MQKSILFFLFCLFSYQESAQGWNWAALLRRGRSPLRAPPSFFQKRSLRLPVGRVFPPAPRMGQPLAQPPSQFSERALPREPLASKLRKPKSRIHHLPDPLKRSWRDVVPIERNKEIASINGEFYLSLQMSPNFFEDDLKKGVSYLSEAELSQNELEVDEEGSFQFKENRGLSVEASLGGLQRNMVINDQGRIILSPNDETRMLKHSSLSGANSLGERRRVIWAGTVGFEVNPDDPTETRVIITNLSGHYEPEKKHVDQAIRYLQLRGLRKVQGYPIPSHTLQALKLSQCIEQLSIGELRSLLRDGYAFWLP